MSQARRLRPTEAYFRQLVGGLVTFLRGQGLPMSITMDAVPTKTATHLQRPQPALQRELRVCALGPDSALSEAENLGGLEEPS